MEVPIEFLSSPRNSPKTDPEREERVFNLIENAIASRAQLINQFMDTRRDIDDECGYPKGDRYVAKDYQYLYDREPVATRVVQVFPKESWQIQPLVYEDDDPKTKTAFEQSWTELNMQLSSLNTKSWHKQEEGSSIWTWIKRADEQSGIGRFGIILLGLNDGLPLDRPVKGVEESNSYATATPKDNKPGKRSPISVFNKKKKRYSFSINRAKTKNRKLLYIRVFPESLVYITQYESNPTSPRFGQPVMYRVTFNDPREYSSGVSSTNLPLATVDVHWTRVIHVADNLGTSPTIGVPRMRPVLNALLDTRKVRGGSAEMYWKGAFPGISFETHPNLGTGVGLPYERMKGMVENYMNGLQRYLALTGMTAKSLEVQVSDPTPQLKVQIEAICIYLGCPMRVFMGSERGQLASSQDDSTWNDRLRERQNTYLTPCLIVPFINRLIELGVLAEPKAEYKVEWPELNSQTDKEKTVIAVGRAKAMESYYKSGLANVITFQDFLVEIMGFKEKTASRIVQNRKADPIPAQIKKPVPLPAPAPTLPTNGKPSPNGKRGGTTGEDKVPSKVRATVPRFGRRTAQSGFSDETANA